MASTNFASQPVRISKDLHEQAKADSIVFNRSIAGQLEHWARIGRAVESLPGFTLERSRAAIEGRLDPAELSATERPYYYELLDDVMEQPGPQEAARRAEIRSGVGYDADGRLVRMLADGTIEPIGEE